MRIVEGLGSIFRSATGRARSMRPAAGAPVAAVPPAVVTAISPVARALGERPPPEEYARSAFVADGREVVLDVKHSASGYENDILVSTDGGSSFTRVGVDDEVATVSLGRLAAGTKVMIAIANHEGFFVAGDPQRNADGLEHARLERLADGATRFGFEDLLGGGDMDFDDAVVELRSVGAAAEATKGGDASSFEARPEDVDVAPPDVEPPRAGEPEEVVTAWDEVADPRELDMDAGRFAAGSIVLAALRELHLPRASSAPAVVERRDLSIDTAARLYATLLGGPPRAPEPTVDALAPEDEVQAENADADPDGLAGTTS